MTDTNGSHGAGVDVLAFGPHPDDVELFCGGLLAAAAARGQSTVVVDLTRGERASRGTPEQRAREADAAAAVLGVRERVNLGLPDAGLDPRDETALLAVVRTLRRLRAELVIAPWERERHPDHEAASALVTRAVFLAGLARFDDGAGGAAHTPRRVLYYPQRQLERPSVIVDVSASYETKTRAIACHASQVGATASPAQTLVGSPLSLSSLEARDRFYGAQIGVAHGEPYVSREAIGLADPLDHFRRNAFARPLFFPERA